MAAVVAGVVVGFHVTRGESASSRHEKNQGYLTATASECVNIRRSPSSVSGDGIIQYDYQGCRDVSA